MTQYNTLNVTMPTSTFNKIKSGIKNVIEVALNLLSNVIDNSNDGTNFLHKLLLTNTQDSRLSKALQIIPQLI